MHQRHKQQPEEQKEPPKKLKFGSKLLKAYEEKKNSRKSKIDSTNAMLKKLKTGINYHFSWFQIAVFAFLAGVIGHEIRKIHSSLNRVICEVDVRGKPVVPKGAMECTLGNENLTGDYIILGLAILGFLANSYNLYKATYRGADLWRVLRPNDLLTIDSLTQNSTTTNTSALEVKKNLEIIKYNNMVKGKDRISALTFINGWAVAHAGHLIRKLDDNPMKIIAGFLEAEDLYVAQKNKLKQG